ncbi:MAG: hypothetical protein K0U72_17090 [Gammaproteobacteria bacterium]|nr:hypothetical protein [Gammaproteobacteria bacterium]
MPTEYILIDFENVQPKNLAILEAHPFKVFVFIGANQTKVPRHVAVAMQTMGERAKYVEIDGSGPNALDFHIAYYLGELCTRDSAGSYHVISKDKGFDPLIRHLKGKKIKVRRENDLAEIPNLRIPKKTKKADKIDAIVKNLVNRGHARPRKVKTLQNTISNLVSEALTDTELAELVEEMRKRKLIVVNNGNIKYTLPS